MQIHELHFITISNVQQESSFDGYLKIANTTAVMDDVSDKYKLD